MTELDLSIIVPVFNEEKFLLKQLDRIFDALPKNLTTEVIVINDGSTDKTPIILNAYQQNIITISFSDNQGKGFAVSQGLKKSRGKIILIIDADLEYSPQEALSFIDIILSKEKTAVYGNRMHSKNPIGHYRYYLGNLFLSALASLLYGQPIKDVETGCKMFYRTDVLPEKLTQKGFGIEIELTAQLVKSKVIIKQPLISYQPRKFTQGKKINWRDGLIAVYLLFKLRF